MCENLAEKIKKLRKSMGLSQAEFGKRLGISRGNVSDLESGKNKGGNIKLLNALSDLSGKDISYFADENTKRVAQYEMLDEAIEMLIKKGLIEPDGTIHPDYKQMIDEILKTEIALKIKRRSK